MKKKWINNAVAICLACTALSSPVSVYAADTQASSEENLKSEITFRDIQWYSSKADVESLLYADGASNGGWIGDENTIFRINALDFLNSWSNSDEVKGGGYHAWYSGVTVAGYTPSDTYACYIYKIDESGHIDHTVDNSELYLGWYTFNQSDFVDHESIFSDLASKLTNLYGQCEDYSDKWKIVKTWHDDTGNQIRLHEDDDKTYVVLAYMAADADARLDAMQTAVDAENAAAEADEREKNASNTDGL